MEIFVLIVVCLVASLGAGLGTGLAGLSAAAVIAPMLTTFLHINSFEAIGIALASDVLASAISAIVYAKHKNIDIKNGLLMMICVLLACIAGTIVGKLSPAKAVGWFNVIGTLAIGIKFACYREKKDKEPKQFDPKWKKLFSILMGIVIGFICGFVGAGGGMMMLFALTMLLGYELKMAVGTSVFIMSVTALVGAGTHFVTIATTEAADATAGLWGFNTWQEWAALGACIVLTMLFAQIGSVFANRVNKKVQNLTTGWLLVVLAIVMIAFKIYEVISGQATIL